MRVEGLLSLECLLPKVDDGFMLDLIKPPGKSSMVLHLSAPGSFEQQTGSPRRMTLRLTR